MIYHCSWVVSSDPHSNCLSKEGRGLCSIFAVAYPRLQTHKFSVFWLSCSSVIFHFGSLRLELTNPPVLFLKKMHLLRAQHWAASFYANLLESTYACLVSEYLPGFHLPSMSILKFWPSLETWTWFIQRGFKIICFSVGRNVNPTTQPWKPAGHCPGGI